MFCKNCGSPMNENQDVCLNCGVRKNQGNGFCANCGQPLNPGAEFCMSCGVKVNKSAGSSNLAGKDKTMLIIVCLLLGGLGIHNFIMGETKKGVVKLVLTITGCLSVISLVFAIIDLVKICTDKYVVEPDKYF